jgi:hypothetical protein
MRSTGWYEIIYAEELIEDLIAEFKDEITRIEAIVALKESGEDFSKAADFLDEMIDKRKKKYEKKQDKKSQAVIAEVVKPSTVKKEELKQE